MESILNNEHNIPTLLSKRQMNEIILLKNTRKLKIDPSLALNFKKKTKLKCACQYLFPRYSFSWNYNFELMEKSMIEGKEWILKV